MSRFEPRILAFACQYCTYNAADLAGSLRLQYPASVRVIRVPCSGKVDPILILRAFEGGADGVLVTGCLEGDCHFVEGNLRARARVQRTARLLAECGFEPARLRMANLSAADGAAWAELVRNFTETVRALGPGPAGPGPAAAGAGADEP